jgi:DNA-binding transcriptional regulator YdaS (Cro superfamily)
MKLKEYLRGRPDRRAMLAQACGVTVAAVTHWANGIRRVPAHYCRRIEAETDGDVTCYELRPDVFGHPVERELA